MSREYFKRTAVALSCVFLLVAYLCASLVSGMPISAESQSVYFIVEPTDSVAASSGSMSIRGGAGYEMADGGVAFCAYFLKEEAVKAHESLLLEYPTAELCTYTRNGGFDAKERVIVTAVKIVDGWIDFLSQGITQNRVREGIGEVIATLQYLADPLAEQFAEALMDCLDGVITVRDLRYTVCFVAERLWNGSKTTLF